MTNTYSPADVNVVLDLAQTEIDNCFEVARRNNDLDIEDSAKALQQTLDHVQPVLEAAPLLLEALKDLLAQSGSVFSGEAKFAAQTKARTAIAAAEGRSA